MTAHVELTAEQVYAEATDFFGRLASPPACGFKVLYGPPLYQPPIFFIGYQPGGNAPEEYSDRWPPACQYATENWALAVKMRQLFGRELLERCCGVNAIFIRSPSMLDYRRDYSRQVRAEVASFCLDRAQARAARKIVRPARSSSRDQWTGSIKCSYCVPGHMT